MSFAELGFLPSQETPILDAIHPDRGLIIVGGGVNSGKSLTAETIVKVAHKRDIQAIYLGEIRDFSGAVDAMQSATMRLTVATMHGKGAINLLERYRLFGVDVSLIKKFLRLVVSQRLVPGLCDHCSIRHIDIDDERCRIASAIGEKFGVDVTRIRYLRDNQRVACETCHGLGFARLLLAAEVVACSQSFLNVYAESDWQTASYYLESLSDRKKDSCVMTGKAVDDHLLYRVLQGEVDGSILVDFI